MKIQNRKFDIKEYRTEIIYIIIAILSLLFIINGSNIGFLFVMITYTFFVAYVLKDFRKNIVMLFFLACFFIFLLGAYSMYEFFGHTRGVVVFEPRIMNHIYISLIISLFGLWGGYEAKFSEFKKDIRNENDKSEHKEKILPRIRNIFSKIGTTIEKNGKTIQKTTLILFFLSFIPYFAIEVLRILVVRKVGYTGLFLGEILQIPYVIRLFANMCPLFLIYYLSTDPNKKKMKLPVIMFLVCCVVTLFTGSRVRFVSNVMLIIIYIFFRDNNSENSDKWITEKRLKISLVMIPVLIIMLAVIGNLRFQNTMYNNNRMTSVSDILVNQGVSVSVIGYGKMYEDKIPNKVYSFGGTIEAFKYNPASRVLFKVKSYTGQNKERALNGNSFAHLISYYRIPKDYLNGRGMGSSFVAEAYHDLGYIGIVLFSFIYGLILRFCSKYNEKSILVKAVILIILSNILISPRAGVDGFITPFLNIDFTCSIISVIIAFIIYNKYKR